jgi:exodeoxyribonuclease VII large subunit
VVVVPAPVQGREAVPGIVGAIELIDEWGEADVAIVGRGGGSLEDLWAFNEEAVARAIFAARTPIVSAVGHEIDTTIADMVADLRAATPSNAGELVVPDGRDLARSVESLRSRLTGAVESGLDDLLERARSHVAAYAFRLPGELVDRLTQRTDDMTRRLSAAVSANLAAAGAAVDRLTSELRLTDPSHIMARGYAAVSLLPSLGPVRSVSDVAAGSEVRVTVADGSFDTEVVRVAANPGRKS